MIECKEFKNVEGVRFWVSTDGQRVWLCINGSRVLLVTGIKDLEIVDLREEQPVSTYNTQVHLSPFGVTGHYFKVIKLVNRVEPNLGSRMDKAAAEALIAEGVTVTIKP